MSDPKVFDFTEEDDTVPDPHEFLIRYQRKQYTGEGDDRKPTGKWELIEEKFSAQPTVPAGLTMATIAAFSQRGAVAANALMAFLGDCMVDEDVIRFNTLIQDRDVKMHMKHLAQIADWLLSEYGGNPTQFA